MKIIKIKNLVSALLAVGAIVVAALGKEGWGWLLFLAFVFYES